MWQILPAPAAPRAGPSGQWAVQAAARTRGAGEAEGLRPQSSDWSGEVLLTVRVQAAGSAAVAVDQSSDHRRFWTTSRYCIVVERPANPEPVTAGNANGGKHRTTAA